LLTEIFSAPLFSDADESLQLIKPTVASSRLMMKNNLNERKYYLLLVEHTY